MASRKNAKFSTKIQFYLKHRESRILKLCNDTIGPVPNDSLTRAIFKLLSKPVDNKRIIQLLADKKRSSTKSTASHSTMKTPQTATPTTTTFTSTAFPGLPLVTGTGTTSSVTVPGTGLGAAVSLPEYQKEVERFRGRIICQDNTCIIDPAASLKNDNNSNPRTHSFRIVSFSKEGGSNGSSSHKASSSSDCSSSPLGGDGGRDSVDEQVRNLGSPLAASTQAGHKAILMCFSCKLSFGTCRSFIAHAKMEHSLTLNDYERMLLEKNYSSAIIQTNTERQFYFLVPFEEKSSANSIPSIKSSVESGEERFKSSISHSLSSGSGGGSQQLSPQQQQVQQIQSSVTTPEKSPGSISFDGGFPKLTPSSMLYDMDNKLQASWKLAAEKYNNAMNESVAAAAAAAAVAAAQEEKNAASGKLLTDFLTQQKMLSAAENLYNKQNKFLELMNTNPLAAAAAKAAAVTGTGVDGSSDFQMAKKYNAMDLYKQLMAANNFRPEGLDLKEELKSEHQISVKKLETEPSAAFRNSNFAPNISTRNSCKTLKCPQCNWHYKYQETLEIHMREKHPDGETACSYCLAGQQHPRLARGESYTCGYKPYRCDICNYSTTTKGNLSIHMQSDKHLNNMQDLNGMMNKGSQNFLNLATLQATEKVNTSRNQYMQSTSPLSLTTKLTQSPKESQPSSYESSRPKSFFKCDICNYDTNIARNLRIHMTSEKHISNLNSLQSSYSQLKNLQNMSSAENLDYLSALNLNALKEESPLSRVEDYSNSSLKPLSMVSSPFASIESTPPISTANSTPTPESLFLNNPSPFSGSSDTDRLAAGEFHQLDEDKNPLHFEPPIRITLDPSTYYTCLICSDFDTNNLEELKKHVIKDRLTSNIAMDTIVIAAASCECLLCGFRSQTADKHDLERHLKTEAHLKRLDLMIHLLEGRDKAIGKLRQFCGSELYKKLSLIFPLAEESKFPYEEMPSIGEISRSPLSLLLEPKTELVEREFGTSNGIDNEGCQPHPDNVQIKCNCCNYYTTSLEKIGIHSLSEKHIFRRICFDYLLLISSEKNSTGGGSLSPLNLQQQHGMKSEENRPGSAGSGPLLRPGHLMLTCVPCGYKTDHIYYMIHHLRKSCKVEQNINLLGLRNIFKLTPKGADSQDAMDSASAATGDNNNGTTALGTLCSILQEKKPWNGENCNGKSGSGTTGNVGSGGSGGGNGDGTCKDRCLVCSVCNNFSSKKINVMQHLLANHNVGNELLAQDFSSMSVPSAIQKKPFDYLRTLTEARSAQNLRLIEKVTFMNDTSAFKENCNDLKHGNLAEILETYMGGAGGKDGGEKQEKHQVQTVSCPLCPETFLDQVNVETHVIRVHNIKMEGLNRLLKLVDTSQFLKTTKQQQLGSSPDKSPKKETSPSPEIKCSFCKVCFDSMVDLKIHCNESNHFKRNADSEDLACFLNDCKDAFDNLADLHQHFKANHLNFLISENHTYKYRCKLCPFAFKTHEKLNRHLFYHSLRESTKCFYCDATFKNINSLTSHITEKHPQESTAQKGATDSQQESTSILFFKDLKRKMMNNKNGMSPKSDRSQTRDSADEDRLSEKSMSSKSSLYYDKSLDGSDGGGTGGGGKLSCMDCRFNFTDTAALERHMATAFHMSKEKEKAAADSLAGMVNKQQLFYDIKSEKFTNPNRPFKCTICMESFTQKNILLVHYNSVSHLNKLKKLKSDKQQQQQQHQFPFQIGASMGDGGDGCEHGDRQSMDFKPFGLQMFGEGGEKRKDLEEKEMARKKFKCDICNVAYTQGSTLDIHMRSVLHQTRACRLQERSMFSNQLQPVDSKKKPEFSLIHTIPESHESPNFIDDTPLRKLKSPADLQQQHQQLQQQQQQQQTIQPAPLTPQPPMLNPMMGALGLGTGVAAMEKPEIVICECCFQVFPNKSTLETHLELSPECLAVKKKLLEGNNPTPESFVENFQQQQVLNDLAKVNPLPGFDLSPEALLGKSPFPLDPTANLMDPNFLKNASLLQFATDPNNKLGPNALNVLNFMHFHHLMSLSYLNLAPQLNFGAVPQKVPDMTAKNDLEKVIPVDKTKLPPGMLQSNLNGKPPLDMNMLAHNLENKMPPQPPQQQPCTQKRARTRITDEQLRILRSHFDINNSPSEESIQEMSLKANLPPKVVKHWFRNTLFKERQRSKDSPYNFSIPPSTKLNVEEYERTGETKVVDLDTSFKSNDSQDTSQNAVDLKMNEMKQSFSKSLMESLSKHQATQELGNFQLNKNLFPDNFGNDFQTQHEQASQLQANVANFFSQAPELNLNNLGKELMSNKKKKIKSENSSNASPIPADLQIDSSNSSPLPMRPPSAISLKKHMEARPLGTPGLMEEIKIPSPIDSPVISPPSSISSGMHQQMAQNQAITCSNGKRANRTRFTDYQIKVLQEFFENNSYPKDSDLEYLSKLLMLSPRVIVVWFQNARQKQRKIYENQPNPTFETDEKKAININYTCKKCNLVFQRYYELIRHQKNHCFKEESNKRSAKAQLAAAQIAHSFTSGSEDSDSSLDVSRRDFQPRENDCPF
ncbi:zinc finger protein 2 [Malaya genurostris]|uniref:zinc finger protein 2 n=1 Tax=Malaya genurostris TaxID=325434 RepID=UPI0026F389B4|nr:zinc finger protein 2 [Malaya genurostris]XP_058444621.1 zinc finger protein 2 [Malaya genurostris]XP_058444622.1 zinc finger protein 2 [Malaya genurostris]